MPGKILLEQVDQLQKVSARLELIAATHSFLATPLTKISETILACATLLDVLVATKLKTDPA
jgi:hypothetical protein